MTELIPVTRAAVLERLAEIDAILDMMDTYDEETLMLERDSLVSIVT